MPNGGLCKGCTLGLTTDYKFGGGGTPVVSKATRAHPKLVQVLCSLDYMFKLLKHMDAFTVESNRRREAAKAEAAGPLAQTSGLRQYRPAPYRSPTQWQTEMSGSSPCTKI